MFVVQELPQAQQLSGCTLHHLPILALARYIGISVSGLLTTGNLDNFWFQTNIHLWLNTIEYVLNCLAADHRDILLLKSCSHVLHHIVVVFLNSALYLNMYDTCSHNQFTCINTIQVAVNPHEFSTLT